MFFELRQYRTKPGQRENWVRFMEEENIPFQDSNRSHHARSSRDPVRAGDMM